MFYIPELDLQKRGGGSEWILLGGWKASRVKNGSQRAHSGQNISEPATSKRVAVGSILSLSALRLPALSFQPARPLSGLLGATVWVSKQGNTNKTI